ncbi:MAG: NAD(+) synthase [Thermomicrobiales bacterium]|nr:NAD(+) synthase [Thermomicrobiales bacterium]MCO5222086.1 NAD(+) synthase [Thermomicrobiales bacterium]
MRLIKIGLGNINTTVGAVESNADQVIEVAQRMAAESVTVALFPEQVIGGYQPEDLVQWQGFVERQWEALASVAARTADLPLVLVAGIVIDHQGLHYNCAAVLAGGVIRALVPKEKLPSYNVFYEGRTMSHGAPLMLDEHRGVPFGDLIVEFDFGIIGVEVCEDLWSAEGPLRRRTYAGAELICNISASPFRIGVLQTRRELISTRAADSQCTLAYTNLIGSNDGLIFDGGGWVNQNGKIMLEAPRFERGFAATVVDLDRTLRLRAENTTWREDRHDYLELFETPATLQIPAEEFSTAAERATLAYPVPAQKSFFLPADHPATTAREQLCDEILDALALGIGDYFEKNRAFKLIGISLSGGRDSLLTLLIAHRYATRVRPEDPGSLIRAFYQPSRYSSNETQVAAETICADLGVPLTIESIDDAFEREMQAALAMLDDGQTLTPITEQNIQARIRAQRMWNWSNSSAGLFLQTGNMTEKSVGYTTVGGDLMGALAVLANVPKTVVMYLLDYLLETRGYPGIAAVLKKPAGPELAPNQSGEDELMPFKVLDACFYLFAGEKMTPAEVEIVVAEMFPDIPRETVEGYVAKFVRLFLQSIYKWVQAPLSLHIGNLDLERERALQLPVVTSSEWTR